MIFSKQGTGHVSIKALQDKLGWQKERSMLVMVRSWDYFDMGGGVWEGDEIREEERRGK